MKNGGHWNTSSLQRLSLQSFPLWNLLCLEPSSLGKSGFPVRFTLTLGAMQTTGSLFHYKIGNIFSQLVICLIYCILSSLPHASQKLSSIRDGYPALSY